MDLDLGFVSAACPGRAVVLHEGGALDVYSFCPFSEPAMHNDQAMHRAPLPGFLFSHADTALTALHVETEIAPEVSWSGVGVEWRVTMGFYLSLWRPRLHQGSVE